jgi:hypothetical protein
LYDHNHENLNYSEEDYSFGQNTVKYRRDERKYRKCVKILIILLLVYFGIFAIIVTFYKELEFDMISIHEIWDLFMFVFVTLSYV